MVPGVDLTRLGDPQGDSPLQVLSRCCATLRLRRVQQMKLFCLRGAEIVDLPDNRCSADHPQSISTVSRQKTRGPEFRLDNALGKKPALTKVLRHRLPRSVAEFAKRSSL